jgi:hypothetical protein
MQTIKSTTNIINTAIAIPTNTLTTSSFLLEDVIGSAELLAVVLKSMSYSGDD